MKLLKDHHIKDLIAGGLGHLRDFKISSNICRPLMGFLMHHIEPSTMTLDLGDGRKRLQFTVETISILFGLYHGRKAPPMPSENAFDEALIKLREEVVFLWINILRPSICVLSWKN